MDGYMKVLLAIGFILTAIVIGSHFLPTPEGIQNIETGCAWIKCDNKY